MDLETAGRLSLLPLVFEGDTSAALLILCLPMRSDASRDLFWCCGIAPVVYLKRYSGAAEKFYAGGLTV